MMDWKTSARDAVVDVGDGRGFIINTEPRLIVTTAHCLPALPPPHAAQNEYEKTWALLGKRDTSQRDIWAECVFADPVADIAIVGEPDCQAFFEEVDAFVSFIASASALACAVPVDTPLDRRTLPTEPAWVLDLEGTWRTCRYKHIKRGLWLCKVDGGIHDGMSGSPVLDDDGRALAVVGLSRRLSDCLCKTVVCLCCH